MIGNRRNARLQAFDRIAAREIQNLPSDIAERRQVIEDLITIMPEKHRLGSELCEFIQSLYRHQLLQRELPLMFGKGAEQ